MSAITNETDRVILRGEWGGEVVCDVTYSGTENIDVFDTLFEIVSGDHQAGEDYYNGLDFMALIRRREDGKLFGYPYWKPLARHADWEPEPNGEDHGFEGEDDVWVWLPVETFAITGYRLAQVDGGSAHE